MLHLEHNRSNLLNTDDAKRQNGGTPSLVSLGTPTPFGRLHRRKGRGGNERQTMNLPDLLFVIV